MAYPDIVSSESARRLILSGTAPADLTVGGGLDLAGCTGLTQPPRRICMMPWMKS